MRPSLTRSKRDAVLFAVGAVVAAMFITPAGAHVGGTVTHLWTKHIKPKVTSLVYTKAQSDSRYYTKTQSNSTFYTKAQADSAFVAKDQLPISVSKMDGGSAVPTTATAVLDGTIAVPGPGKVLATATGNVFTGALSAGDDYAMRLKLNEGSSTDTEEDGNIVFLWHEDTPATTYRQETFSTQRVFDVASAGDFTVNLTMDLTLEPTDGFLQTDETVLTLMYLPTGG